MKTLHEVTWYSKWGTVFVFVIVVPVVAFFVGKSYQELKAVQALTPREISTTTETTPIPVGTTAAASTTTTFPTEIATSTWKEYKNDELGFSIKYPSDLVIVPDTHSTSVTFKFPDTYFSTVMKDQVVVSVYAERLCSPVVLSGHEGTISENMMVGGINFTRNEQYEIAAGNRYLTRTYDVIRNQVCYRTTFFVHGANGAGLYESDPAKIKEIDIVHDRELQYVTEIFGKMLESFDFVDTPEGINEALIK
jgi:hypothetical protein